MKVILAKKITTLLLVPVLFGLAAGCTSEQLYSTGQSYQRNQCLHLPDPADQQKCLSSTNTTYQDYKRETDADKK